MILIDSNIWIFANIQEYPEHEHAVNAIKRAENKGIVINDIIVSEVYHKLSILLKSKTESKIRVKKILESSCVSFMPIEKRSVFDALEISTTKDLRINDSLIAQHCIENNFEMLTDNTKDFERINGLKIIGLR